MNKLLLISKYTFLEIYKSKIMLSAFILGALTFLISYVASAFSFGAPERVALDFGFGVLSLFSVGVSLFIGVTLISRELENRTIYMLLARPIRREIFILGKILGLVGILVLNILIFGFAAIGTFLFLGGSFQPLLPWVLLFIFFEAFLVLLFVIFFSLITNMIMAVIYTLLVFVTGHALSSSLSIIYVKENPFFLKTLTLASWLLPNFSKINLKELALYQQSVSPEFLFGSLAYVLVYSAFLLLLIIKIFSKKNLD